MNRQKSNLIFAAHPDDEILGCGGLISELASRGERIKCVFLSDGETSRKISNSSNIDTKFTERIKLRQESAIKVSKYFSIDSPKFFQFMDNNMDNYPLLEIIKVIEQEIIEFDPYRVITHFPGDLNIDHKLVSKATITASRPLPGSSIKELLFFETLSSTEFNYDLSDYFFRPNLFIDISSHIERKIEALQFYNSEIRDFPHPRSLDGVKSLSKYRGMCAGFDLAEAFILARKTNI